MSICPKYRHRSYVPTKCDRSLNGDYWLAFCLNGGCAKLYEEKIILEELSSAGLGDVPLRVIHSSGEIRQAADA